MARYVNADLILFNNCNAMNRTFRTRMNGETGKAFYMGMVLTWGGSLSVGSDISTTTNALAYICLHFMQAK